MFQTGCLHYARPLFSTHMLVEHAYKLIAVSIKHNLFNLAYILLFWREHLEESQRLESKIQLQGQILLCEMQNDSKTV